MNGELTSQQGFLNKVLIKLTFSAILMNPYSEDIRFAFCIIQVGDVTEKKKKHRNIIPISR